MADNFMADNFKVDVCDGTLLKTAEVSALTLEEQSEPFFDTNVPSALTNTENVVPTPAREKQTLNSRLSTPKSDAVSSEPQSLKEAMMNRQMYLQPAKTHIIVDSTMPTWRQRARLVISLITVALVIIIIVVVALFGRRRN